jgi:hypothetical protein
LKFKVSVIAIVATLVFAATAAACSCTLNFGYAKRSISRETASICAGANGCKSWSVSPCRRQSRLRVDCLANFFFPEGATCHAVMIAIWNLSADEVFLHHKRIIC